MTRIAPLLATLTACLGAGDEHKAHEESELSNRDGCRVVDPLRGGHEVCLQDDFPRNRRVHVTSEDAWLSDEQTRRTIAPAHPEHWVGGLTEDPAFSSRYTLTDPSGHRWLGLERSNWTVTTRTMFPSDTLLEVQGSCDDPSGTVVATYEREGLALAVGTQTEWRNEYVAIRAVPSDRCSKVVSCPCESKCDVLAVTATLGDLSITLHPGEHLTTETSTFAVYEGWRAIDPSTCPDGMGQGLRWAVETYGAPSETLPL